MPNSVEPALTVSRPDAEGVISPNSGWGPAARLSGDRDPVPGGEAHLEARELTWRVGDRAIVDGVSVTIPHGDILAIVGPSGAGKSSLLRLLNRLEEPTGGSVLIGDMDYRILDPRHLRRRVGMVMQRAVLFPGTVASNVQFGPAQFGRPLPPDRVARLLRSIGLANYEDREVSTLSGGEAQRVSFARTLANDPEVLLLDEPTSALDEVAARAVENLVLRVNRTRNMTCVIVTHSDAQALRIAAHTMLMENGRVATIGRSRDVLNAR